MKSRRFFFRRSFLLFLPVLTMLVVTARVLTLPPTYTATTSLQIVQDTVATDMGVDRNDPWNSPAQQNAGAFNEFKMLPSFLQTVIDKAHLAQPISVRPQDDDLRYEKLVHGLNAYAQSGRLMGVNLVWGDADECNRLVTAAAEEFQTEMIGERSASSIKTVQFLDGEIKKIENQLRSQELIEREAKILQTSKPLQWPHGSAAVKKIYRDHEIAQLRKFVEMREGFALKTKLQNVSANSVYIPAVPPHALPVHGTTYRAFATLLGFLVGVLLSLILLAVRAFLERRAGKVKQSSEPLPVKERTDAQNDFRPTQESSTDGRNL